MPEFNAEFAKYSTFAKREFRETQEINNHKFYYVVSHFLMVKKKKCVYLLFRMHIFAMISHERFIIALFCLSSLIKDEMLC